MDTSIHFQQVYASSAFCQSNYDNTRFSDPLIPYKMVTNISYGLALLYYNTGSGNIDNVVNQVKVSNATVHGQQHSFCLTKGYSLEIIDFQKPNVSPQVGLKSTSHGSMPKYSYQQPETDTSCPMSFNTVLGDIDIVVLKWTFRMLIVETPFAFDACLHD